MSTNTPKQCNKQGTEFIGLGEANIKNKLGIAVVANNRKGLRLTLKAAL